MKNILGRYIGIEVMRIINNKIAANGNYGQTWFNTRIIWRKNNNIRIEILIEIKDKIIQL